MIIKATKNCKNFDESILDELYMTAQLICADEDFPMPWDAEISVEDGNIVLSGGVYAGGSNVGNAVVRVTPDYFNKVIRFDLPELVDPEVVVAIKDAGWDIVE